MDQSDLFATPLIAGLAIDTEAVTPDEERALIGAIDRTDPLPFRFQGWLGKRLTSSFGWHYDFDQGGLGEAKPIPDWLETARTKATAFAGLDAGALVQALLTRYDPGAGIGWHRDRPVFEHVVGISLGADAILRFRRRTETGFERLNLPVPRRSIYHLSGAARHVWEHSIAPMAATRWSITFRSLSNKGLRLLAG